MPIQHCFNVQLEECWINILNLEDFNEVTVCSLQPAYTQAGSSIWVKFRMNAAAHPINLMLLKRQQILPELQSNFTFHSFGR